MVESFLRYIQYEKGYSSHTVTSYKNDLCQFRLYVERESGEFDLKMVDSDIIRNWMVELAESGSEVATVKRKISVLRSFFKYLRREGVVDKSPLSLISLPKSRRRLPVFVREDQMDRLIDDFDFGDSFCGVRDRLIIMMLYSTGVRRSELVGLKEVDVDFFSAIIRVTGKGNKQRLIPFGAELGDLMKIYLKMRERLCGEGVDFFFIRENGEQIYTSLVYRIVTKYLSMVSSLAKKSPHVLRHTFATVMLGSGAELSAVKELLGHSTLSSTEVYTHVSSKEIMTNYNLAHPRANKEKGG